MAHQIFSWLSNPWHLSIPKKARPTILALAMTLLPITAHTSIIDDLIQLASTKQKSNNQKNTTDDNLINDNTTIHLIEEALPPSATPDLLTILQAEFAADRDDLDTALALYKAEAFKQNATAVFERALSLSLQLEPTDSSLSFAKAWQDSHTDHVPVWFYVTHLALKSSDYATATHNLKLILSYDPKADLSRIFSGIFPASVSEQRALFFALQSVGNDNNPSLAVIKAGLLNQFNEHEAAILYLDKAIHAEPNNLAFLTLKADMLKGKNKHIALQKFLQDAQKHTTGETQKQLYLYQIRGLIDQGELKKAWELLGSTHKTFPHDNQITFLASLVALDLNHYQSASKLLRQLTTHPQYQSQANYYLGISHERQQKYKEALEYYRLVDDVDLIVNARKKMVAYQIQMGDTDEAINTLIDWRQHHPSFASESYTMQADILIKLGKVDEAKQLLAQATKDYPDDPTLLYAATMLLDDKADFVQKLDNIELLLSFEPTHPRYLLEEARLHLINNPNNKQALKTATTISQLPLDDPDYDSQLQLDALMVLANHDLQQGHFHGIIDKLQSIYDIKPNLAVGTLLLRAHQGLGEHDKVHILLKELKERFSNGTPSKKSASQTPP